MTETERSSVLDARRAQHTLDQDAEAGRIVVLADLDNGTHALQLGGKMVTQTDADSASDSQASGQTGCNRRRGCQGIDEKEGCN